MAEKNFNVGATRCKPGDRAKIIKALIPENIGLIVCVVRPYRPNEMINGSSWVDSSRPWVTVSLARGMASTTISGPNMGKTESCRTAVFDDSCLMPLSDDDAGATIVTSKKKPRIRKQTALV